MQQRLAFAELAGALADAFLQGGVKLDQMPGQLLRALEVSDQAQHQQGTAGTDPEQRPEQRVERPVQALAVDVQLVGQGDVAGDDDLVGRFEQGRDLLDDLRGWARGDGIAPGAWSDQRSLSSIRRCRVACTSGRGSARCLNNDWRRSGAIRLARTSRRIARSSAWPSLLRAARRPACDPARRAASRSATARCAGWLGCRPGAPPATAQPRRSAPESSTRPSNSPMICALRSFVGSSSGTVMSVTYSRVMELTCQTVRL